MVSKSNMAKNFLLALSLPLVAWTVSSQTFAAKLTLPILATKQNTSNIRFISEDGKITYYQNNSGNLIFSTNYAVKTLLKKKEGTQFYVFLGAGKKKITVMADEFYHNMHSLNHPAEIYLGDYGGAELTLIGRGTSPKLHLNDTWISFYNSFTKDLEIHSLSLANVSFKIRLHNPTNAYFVPNVYMLDTNTVLFTDLNSKGVMGVLSFSRGNKKMTPVYKTNFPGTRIEFCDLGDSLYIGQFGTYDLVRESSISALSLQAGADSLNSLKTIYTSSLPDLGNMICHEKEKKIYFIQAQKDPITNKFPSFKYDLASLEVESKEVKTLTTVGDVFQVLNMDEQILIPYQGQFYVVKGDNKATQDQLEKINSDKVVEEIEKAITSPAKSAVKEKGKP